MNNRRRFLKTAAITAGAVLSSGCSKKEEVRRSARSRTSDVEIRVQVPNDLKREDFKKRLDQRVNLYMNSCRHCAQSTFVVLQEEFGIQDTGILKALTPLPGIAERGETCGAVTGSLMVLGLAYGRERLDDWTGFQECLKPAREFCSRFIQKFGSTQCRDIVEKEFGRKFNLADEKEFLEFQQSRATERCSKVVREAVSITSDILFEHRTV